MTLCIEQLTVGPLDVNCYIIADEITKDALCIDPGGDVDDIIEVIKNNDLKLKYIVNTHGHFDHIGGNEMLKQKTGARLAIHKDDAALLKDAIEQAAFFGIKSKNSPEPDILLKHGDALKLGNMDVKIIHTPGHTKGGICLFIPAPAGCKQGNDTLFTGDTLFADSVGRSDLPGGSFGELISSIKDKLMAFSNDVKVYPGHGPATTIGEERENNSFLRD
ncbi:MAG: MBL fold metallo-hydrolase [Deltaproteobacteria bacterium]|nr:MBL fold metallo-hydrolase [Deltaproteobacteria bacterium]